MPRINLMFIFWQSLNYQRPFLFKIRTYSRPQYQMHAKISPLFQIEAGSVFSVLDHGLYWIYMKTIQRAFVGTCQWRAGQFRERKKWKYLTYNAGKKEGCNLDRFSEASRLLQTFQLHTDLSRYNFHFKFYMTLFLNLFLRQKNNTLGFRVSLLYITSCIRQPLLTKSFENDKNKFQSCEKGKAVRTLLEAITVS